MDAALPRKSRAEISVLRKMAGQKGGFAKAGRATRKVGRPHGARSIQSLEKQAIKESIDQRIMRSTAPIVDAQLSLARGVSMLYYVHTTKKGVREKPVLIEDRATIEAYLADELENNEEDYYFITTKEPNNEAIKNLLDRVHGKPKETMDVNQNVKFSLVELARSREMIDGNKDMTVLESGPAALLP